jgi:hypothetical protein
MKKLHAKNRTEVAIKAADVIEAARCAFQSQCPVGEDCTSVVPPMHRAPASQEG